MNSTHRLKSVPPFIHSGHIVAQALACEPRQSGWSIRQPRKSVWLCGAAIFGGSRLSGRLDSLESSNNFDGVVSALNRHASACGQMQQEPA